MDATTWAEVVDHLLKGIGRSESALAAECGMLQPSMHRYVHGQRTPIREDAYKINAVMAKFMGVPAARLALNWYAREFDRPEAFSRKRCLTVVSTFLNDFENRLQSDYAAKIADLTASWSEAQMVEFTGKMVEVGLHRMSRMVDGLPPDTPYFDQFMVVCADAGISVSEIAKEESKIMRSFDLVEVDVREALTDFFRAVREDKRDLVRARIICELRIGFAISMRTRNVLVDLITNVYEKPEEGPHQ